jgi:hypothetical protein
MSFGMGMSLGQIQVPQQVLRQEQRQELEQCLEAKLAQQQVQEVTLAQHLVREGDVEGFVQWASDNETWERFNRDGFNFVFARLPYEVAKPVADEYGFAFSHCHYNPFEARIFGKQIALAMGDWTLFLVDDHVPADLQEIAVLHERGEELSGGDHFFASELEFAYAGNQARVRPYVKFIDEIAPSKFVDLTERGLHPIPEELMDVLAERQKVKNVERDRASALIKRHPIPTSALKLMERYEEATSTVCENLREAIGLAQRSIRSKLLDYSIPLSEIVPPVNALITEAVRSVQPKYARGVSPGRADMMVRDFNKTALTGVYDARRENLVMPKTFHEVYRLAHEGKPIVTIQDSSKDLTEQ